MLQKLRLQTKLTLFVILVLFVSNTSVAVVGILMLREGVYTEKQAQTREIVCTAIGIFKSLEGQVKAEKLTAEEARTRAKETIRAMLFGPHGKDYLWVNDLNHIMILHPMNPGLDGKTTYNLVDRNGIYMFREFVRVSKEKGSGFVEYQWQYYDDKSRIEPKLSYVELFRPWGWVVGTGIYIDDVAGTVMATVQGVLLIALVMLVLVVLLGVLFARRLVVRPLT